jgi:hypothetical protein
LPSNTTSAIRSGNFTNKDLIYGLKKRAENFTQIDSWSCLEQYSNALQATSDVVIVARDLTSDQNNGSSLIQGWVNGLTSTEWEAANSWVCGAHEPYAAWDTHYCSPAWVWSFDGNWELFTWEATEFRQIVVDHCLIGE